jgi:hypothetical protein
VLGVDPDEGVGTNLKAVYAQVHSGILYFKIEHYRNWTSLDDLFDVIWLDTDQNQGTGMLYLSMEACICLGPDYVVVLDPGYNMMYAWDPDSSDFDWDNPISLAYLDAPENANVLKVGVYLSDLGDPAAFDCAVSQGATMDDWAPDDGSFTYPPPFCGDVNADSILNLGDVVYLISYLYKGGPPPDCDGAPAVNTNTSQNPTRDDPSLLGTDPDEGVGPNIKAVYAAVYSDILYFMVEHYRNWTTLDDLFNVILLDADRNTGTGENTMFGMMTCMGIDYLIGVAGDYMHEMYRWNSGLGDFDYSNPIPLAFLEAPEDTNILFVGVYLSDLQNPAALDLAVTQGASYDDFAPDCGHYTFPPCPCGDVNADRIVDIGDVVYMISYLYKGGPPPQCE